MGQQVIIADHPGYVERYKATVIPGLHEIQCAQDVEPSTVVTTEAGEILVVRSRHVFTPEGLRYAEEWATLQHKSIFDVRVPDALAVK